MTKTATTTILVSRTAPGSPMLIMTGSALRVTPMTVMASGVTSCRSSEAGEATTSSR